LILHMNPAFISTDNQEMQIFSYPHERVHNDTFLPHFKVTHIIPYMPWQHSRKTKLDTSYFSTTTGRYKEKFT